MANFLSLEDVNSVFFVGIGGISMSALAKKTLILGKKVRGSDTATSNLTDELKSLGATIFLGHRRQNLGSSDLLVYSSSISISNPEIKEAIERGIPILKRSEYLALILQNYKKVIGVSGSHGKTTSTAMIADILINGGLEPAVFLGGESENYGNFRNGEKDYAVVEACEYKKNFLNIKPSLALVLNIDNDHFDSYDGMEDMTDAFNRFIGKNMALVNADDKECNKVFNSSTITFGIKNNASYTAKNIKYNGLGYSFSAYAYGKKLGRINLRIAGYHNVYNALSALAVADIYGVDFKKIKFSLERFGGVKRRNEKIGYINGVIAYADYAHHPSEIDATLSLIKDENSRPLVVFQPHTYSRTAILMKEFVEVFKACENLIIYKTYPAREKYNEQGSAEKLYQNLLKINKSVKYALNVDELSAIIKQNIDNNDYDKIIFLGAGDIYDLAKRLTI